MEFGVLNLSRHGGMGLNRCGNLVRLQYNNISRMTATGYSPFKVSVILSFEVFIHYCPVKIHFVPDGTSIKFYLPIYQ
jgi:hypothetical protein